MKQLNIAYHASCMAVALFMGHAASALAAPAAGSATAAPAVVAANQSIHGVVQKVTGGRVTVRLDDGRTAEFSLKPGVVKVGQRIQAQTVSSGDALRLDQVRVAR